jgi:hypothetical protein
VANDAPRSGALELANLGLRVAFGSRGEAVAEYLEKRRDDRWRARLARLASAAREAGIDEDTLLDRIEDDDEFQELFETAAETATRSRYDEKIDYLGRVLANAVKGQDGARLDTSWLRIRAVEDLEPFHVQLLWLIDECEREVVASAQSVTEGLLRRNAKTVGLDLAAFEASLGLVRRHGLVEEVPELDLDIHVELSGANFGDAPVGADAYADSSEVFVSWKLTKLGREILRELHSAAGLSTAT